MRKGDVLCWGMKHIASNYKMGAATDYEDEGSVCIYVTDEHPNMTPAPIGDVGALCEDLGIPREYIHIDRSFGVDIEIDWEWTQEGGLLQQEYTPTGLETWKKSTATIGE